MTPDVLTTALVELIKASAAVVVAAVTVGLPVWLKLRGIGRQVDETRDQVSNDHTTNLRDDVDELRAQLDDVRSEITQNKDWIGSLALEVRRVGEHLEGRPRRWWR